ncbi:hemerythrin domain-containing protein [Nonomuraea sp. B12E4]|uniref:hemerythrin domain-containing protein n=1 Tax=Nonomuraea sp. B12E4 TaxID=3153564 RepID=UPI00325C39E5
MNIPTSSEHGVAGLPDHLLGFALMHVAMRRDARRLVTLAPTLPEEALPRVADWWRQVREVIDWHHRSEDNVVWPELRRRVPGFAADEKAMAHDHVALDQAMEAMTGVLAPGGHRPSLLPAARWFEDLVLEHLRLEEALVFPAFGRIGAPEYLSIERRVLARAPFGVLTFLYPWMLDEADPAAAAKVSATVPPPVRLLGSTVLHWRYYHTRRWW